MEEEWAPAKVNLTLRVTGRRGDGKHTLDSLVVFAGVADRLALEPGRREPRLLLDGRFARGLTAGADNLVLRAADAVATRDPRAACAAFRLTKSLPTAAGLGGGSADAAAALRLLARAFALRGLEAMAAELGADVPVCVASRPARMQGIGEVLTPAPRLPRFGLCLVNPGVAVSTAQVFAAYPERASEAAAPPVGWEDAEALAADLRRIGNDLEATAVGLCPVIAELLAALAAAPGVLASHMSGSGATCYGLFRSASAAAAAAAAARGLGRGWWCWGGGLAVAPEPGDEGGALRAVASGPMTARPWGVAKR